MQVVVFLPGEPLTAQTGSPAWGARGRAQLLHLRLFEGPHLCVSSGAL